MTRPSTESFRPRKTFGRLLVPLFSVVIALCLVVATDLSGTGEPFRVFGGHSSAAAAGGMPGAICTIGLGAAGLEGRQEAPPASQGKELTFHSAREFLDFLGVGTSDFGDLVDGRPWQEHENALLYKLLFHLYRHFDWADLEGWSIRPTDWAQVLGDVEAFRGQVLHVEGLVRKAEAIDLPPEAAVRLGFRRFFRAAIEPAAPPAENALPTLDNAQDTSTSQAEITPDGDDPVRHRADLPPANPNSSTQEKRPVFSVFTLDLPQAWLEAGELRERAAAYGLFLKIGEGAHEKAVLYFAAKRIAWYPATILGQLGMDVGLFELLDRPLPAEVVREIAAPPQVARFRLGPHNRECFYQLLAAVGRAKPGQLLQQARAELRREGLNFTSVVPLFNEPARQRGRLVLLSGSAREVIRVDVPDRDIRRRFGITHYYQIHLFTEDSQGNPLVACVRELPPGMPVGADQNYAESVVVAGFFFNTWAYRRRAEDSTAPDKVVWQLAPLIVAREVVWIPRPPEGAGPWVTLAATIVLLVVLVAIWWGMIQTARAPRKPLRLELER